MLHPTLQALLDAVEAAEADARDLTSGLSDAQGNWQPDGGAHWSVVQCLDHLAKINVFYVGHFLPIAEQARADRRGPFSGLAPSWAGRKFLSILEPPVKQRAKAPGNVVPAASVPVGTALEAYVHSHDNYRRLVALANDVDVNRAVGPNPFFRMVRMRLATALQIIPAHDRRHLWQARQVLARPEFPR